MTSILGAGRFVLVNFADMLAPRQTLDVATWMSQNIVLVDGPRAGSLWSADGAPYLVEPANCLSEDHPCRVVTIRKSQQTGASILALGWCLYVADQEPANMLYGVPGIDSLQSMNGQKLQPLIDAWQKRTGRAVIAPQTLRSGDGSTTYAKRFPGGFLQLANANSVMDLSSATIMKGVKDELSKWQDIPGSGDPETLFFGRFTSFRRSGTYKILEISTPEIDSGDELADAPGHCRIDRSFRRSDQRYWNITCMECGETFVQTMRGFEEGINRKNPAKSVYVCPGCGHCISDAERVAMVKAGRWIATQSEPDRHPGFHVDAFMSLMMSYEAIAEDAIRAERGSERDKKDFSNLVLGLPYRMRGNAPDHVRLMERREDYPENVVPPLGLLFTCGADVQHSGIWLEVVAFAPDRQSWSVSARFLEGDTTDPDAGAFAKLAEVYDEKFVDSFGRWRQIDAMAIDAGDGGRANQVYAFTRGRHRAYAIKGVPGWSRPALGTPTDVDIRLTGKKVVSGRTKVWPVGTWSLKANFYADLRKAGMRGGQEEDPPGYCHLSEHNDEPYFRQITAEYLDDVTIRGRTSKVWKETYANHLLDCRVYAMAMAEHMGLSRKTKEQWIALRRALGAEAPIADLFSPPALAVEVAQGPTEAPTDKPDDAFDKAMEGKRSRPVVRRRARMVSWGIE